ncbi:aldo/keto reductase [Streptomyces sp. NPDC058579]|uniref:aldo/keto reductase n=1 Tax=Streptomyces sp. NPDC058579 TaxID=3346548 RepID=UPI00365B8D27
MALGAATFGTEWGWGAERNEARKLFDLDVERGGNFIDTADTYTNGSSELLLGEFTRENRESLVLATKYTTLRRHRIQGARTARICSRRWNQVCDG